MQCVLARLIFETAFGPPSGTFYMVPVLDWSQGHAAQPADALSPSNMLVGNTGASATHLRPTSWPQVMGGPKKDVLIQRTTECRPGCKECKAVAESSTDPNLQTVGYKGLKIVLSERGLFKKGMVQADCVAALEKCEDFAAKSLADRAYVTEYFAKHGHQALFGAKYHAELMWIERKWMHLKRLIRGDLDGGLPRLKLLLRKHFRGFTCLDACKAGRHCRTTMHAYQKLSDGATLDALTREEKKMKGHRRVIDASDNVLKLQADLVLDDKAKFFAQRTEITRKHRAEDATDLAEFQNEQAAKRRRKNQLKVSTEKHNEQKEASIARLKKSIARKKEGSTTQLTLTDMISKTFKKHDINQSPSKGSLPMGSQGELDEVPIEPVQPMLEVDGERIFDTPRWFRLFHCSSDFLI